MLQGVLLLWTDAHAMETHAPAWNTSQYPHRAWTSTRVRAVADSVRSVLDTWHDVPAEMGPPLSEEEVQQALKWALYPKRVTGAYVVVYANKHHKNIDLLSATAPFPVRAVRQEGEWKGTLDKLLGYWSFLRTVEDDDIVVFLDAFDVFGNGFDGHELLRRYFSFQRPIVIATEENVFPREVNEQAHVAVDVFGRLGFMNASAPSRYVNAGGIIGIGWALKRIYQDMRENMAANDPGMLMAHADVVGHWFLHSYDQYELWRYFIRHVMAVHDGEAELLLTLDTEQMIFGSTVLRKDNWPGLLEGSEGGVGGKHSIDVDVPLVFDAPQELWEVSSCSARFVGRKHFPIFWHGHGPWKPAWEGLRDRLASYGCFSSESAKPAIITVVA